MSFKGGFYSAHYLRTLPTLGQGMIDDLKLRENGLQYWLSRVEAVDGNAYGTSTVTIEELIDGTWTQIFVYDGDKFDGGGVLTHTDDGLCPVCDVGSNVSPEGQASE